MSRDRTKEHIDELTRWYHQTRKEKEVEKARRNRKETPLIYFKG